MPQTLIVVRILLQCLVALAVPGGFIGVAAYNYCRYRKRKLAVRNAGPRPASQARNG